MNLIDNLFGWSDMQPTKITQTSNKLENLFHNVNNISKVIAAIDGSGSTTFTTSGNSFDNLNFAQIYSYALNVLHRDILTAIPTPYDLYGWSDDVKKFSKTECDTYLRCIEIGTPFAQQILGLDSGTQPFKLLEFMKNTATVLVTDGDIPHDQVKRIQANIKSINSGPVYLIIVPHIGVHKDMYKKDVEANAMNNINISIPQAFAEKLACVLIWHHRKKTFELIKELTAPWLLPNIVEDDIASVFKVPMPLITQGSYLLRVNDSYKTFSVDDIVNYVRSDNNEPIEHIVDKLVKYNVSNAIIQQGNVIDKEKYNAMCLNLFNKGMNEYMQAYKEETSDTTDILELIKLSVKNNNNKKKLESEYVNKYKNIFNNLMINKTVGEINNIAAAKTLQTKDNVKSFQAMPVSNKLMEISCVLCTGECTICTTTTNVFKVVSIPADFFTYLFTTITEKESRNKKGRITVIKKLNITDFKAHLSTHKPSLYYMNLCHTCANETIQRAKLNDDPEYGITGIIPQNIVDGNVKNRLMLLPLIDPKNINDYCNPNEPRLSFCRQVMRSFISKYTDLDVQGEDTMVALLMFLTFLANNKENANLIFATQMSVLRGGGRDKYAESVARLFKPTVAPISSQVLERIMAVENVVELAELAVLPESRKLLLLCLIERRITPLLHANNYREKSIAELKNLLLNRSPANERRLNLAYDFSEDQLKELVITPETLDISKFSANVAFNVQQRGIHIDQIIACENNLKAILTSEDSDTLAKSLELDPGYFKNIIEKCGISDAQFIKIIPQFISDIIGVKGDSKRVMDIILDHVKGLGKLIIREAEGNVSI